MNSKSIAEAVMDKQIEAYNVRDITAFLECFSDDIKFYDLESQKKNLGGKLELRKVFEKLFKDNPDLKMVIKNRIVCGDFITDHEVITGVSTYPKGVEVVSINEVRSGLICKIWFSPAVKY